MRPLFGARWPTNPLCPVNQRSPSRSKVALLRFAYGVPAGSANTRTARSGQPTRTIAFWPPSVSHAAWSGPSITPCGAEPLPSATSSTRALFGSNQPRWPLRCAVNQTPPSGAGATSWMPVGRRVASGQLCTLAATSARARPGVVETSAPAVANKASASRRVRICMAGLLDREGAVADTLYSSDEACRLQALCARTAARPDGGSRPRREARDEDDDVLHVRVPLRHPRPPARRRAALHRRQPEPPDQQGRDLRQGRRPGS